MLCVRGNLVWSGLNCWSNVRQSVVVDSTYAHSINLLLIDPQKVLGNKLKILSFVQNRDFILPHSFGVQFSESIKFVDYFKASSYSLLTIGSEGKAKTIEIKNEKTCFLLETVKPLKIAKHYDIEALLSAGKRTRQIEALLQNIRHYLNIKPIESSGEFSKLLFCLVNSSNVARALVTWESSADELEALYHAELKRTISNLCQHFAQNKTSSNEELLRILRRLVGLGSGSTPSGDDFVLGFILAFICTTGDASILPGLSESSFLMKTTTLSQMFFLRASEGLFANDLMMLALQMFAAEGANFCDIMASILSWGHTSGLDTLCGFYLALLIVKVELSNSLQEIGDN